MKIASSPIEFILPMASISGDKPEKIQNIVNNYFSMLLHFHNYHYQYVYLTRNINQISLTE